MEVRLKRADGEFIIIYCLYFITIVHKMFYKGSVAAEVKDLENLTLIYEDSRIILKNKEYESLSSKKGDVMDTNTLESILEIGETVAVEFKRCGNGIENDTYESVCSFLNRFGGDIFLGVLDNGKVKGIPEKSAPDMVKNFISVVSNPLLFSPTIYLSPEIIKNEEGKTIIHIHIPPSAEVHSYKKVIYDRVDDADVKVTSTSQIAQMYIRKQEIFTERRIYPYATIDDLRLDLLPKVRRMAVNNAGGKHPWTEMSDQELLVSSGLYCTDLATGQKGYNLAAIMLLGKDEVIMNICPTYMTDALLRKVNFDRYDDREIVKTNLIESYDILMEFARKHLSDKFFLENTNRVSLRNIISREMISNTLMHREFTSSFVAKFVIESNRMYIENANRSVKVGYITPENLEPNPKNPLIASFFRNIGYADTLGSGTRKLYKYSEYYSGKYPELEDGDIFRITVPLDDSYSFDFIDEPQKAGNEPQKVGNEPQKAGNEPQKVGNEPQKIGDEPQKAVRQHRLERIIEIILDNPHITRIELSSLLRVSEATIKRDLSELNKRGEIEYIGSSKAGKWVVK